MNKKQYRQYLFHKIKNLDPELLDEFVKTYLRAFVIRPMLFCGRVGGLKPIPRDNPEKKWIILLDQEIESASRIKEVLFHEIIHLFLFTIGVEENFYHNERMIDSRAKVLADKHPEIITAFEKNFPGLSLSVPLKRYEFGVPTAAS
jgi:hypothetical protein